MEFRKTLNGFWQIKINDEWHLLCVCRSCKSIHAHYSSYSIVDVDDKLKCCEHPDNYVADIDSKWRIMKFVCENKDKD